MPSVKVVRWGILATGGIARTFTKDLLLDPSTRGVDSVKHVVSAVASSHSIERAREFIIECGCPDATRAYGSYSGLARDEDIDIVYVASPHSHHYQHAMLCLEAGKNVLCEKPITVNADQVKRLIKKAQEKGLFLMQALWTRYLPPSIYVSDVIQSGRIGNVHRITADTSIAMDPERNFADGNHRMVNPDLAGGALLDLGPYSLSWCFQAVLASQPEVDPPSVVSAVKRYKTRVDETTTMILTFPRAEENGGDIHGIATASMRVSMDADGRGSVGPCVRVQGDKGEIQVFPPSYRPTKTRVVLSDGSIEDRAWEYPGPGKGSGWYNGFGELNAEGEGHGMFWEADEAAMALIEGRKEGRRESLKEVVHMIEMMDKVRDQHRDSSLLGLIVPALQAVGRKYTMSHMMRS
ncbi:dimeric dihydrodiol dehydrogenase [Lepidopterella palustris CBS 459.81]|uniref:D-xylose 1-dehydrogenase (NADP(+), D-xylono-1,5-lactone-forming) n=1 Tax=Lepidopterella palustris CBS 459.81 TaxID=1314670 RepID=A0A8E2EE66_9PEZI|nr:dimeric dihydrodiol dehydrogenase [Lepidopterella palustris CBS 459.81]